MTKDAVPVCGAPTRAGTLCQNTLVTGCGRCPVHASQLRAYKTILKPAVRPRRQKLTKTPQLSDPFQPQPEPTDSVLLTTPDPTRPPLAFNEPEDPTSHPNDAFHQFATPMQSFDATTDFQTPLQGMSAFLKDGPLDMSRRSVCSPVTPMAPVERLEELYQEQPLSPLAIDGVAPPPEDALDFMSLQQVEDKDSAGLESSMEFAQF